MSDENEELKSTPDVEQENPGDSEAEEEVVEFEYNADGEEDLKKTLKKLRADIKTLQKEKAEYLTGWQKERADFLNYKKGEDERRAMISESLRERILGEFLTVMDSFNMAFANKEAWEKVDENWRRGVEYIYAQLNTVFENYGVMAFGEVGEVFDPSLHNPVAMTKAEKPEDDHKISLVIQKGYKMGDPSNSGGQGRVIRPARVNVFEYKD